MLSLNQWYTWSPWNRISHMHSSEGQTDKTERKEMTSMLPPAWSMVLLIFDQASWSESLCNPVTGITRMWGPPNTTAPFQRWDTLNERGQAGRHLSPQGQAVGSKISVHLVLHYGWVDHKWEGAPLRMTPSVRMGDRVLIWPYAA